MSQDTAAGVWGSEEQRRLAAETLILLRQIYTKRDNLSWKELREFNKQLKELDRKRRELKNAKGKSNADSDGKGNPVRPPDTGIACEKCGSPVVVRVAGRGPFLACSGFPKCRNTKSINAELREQLKAKGIDLPAPPPEAEKGKGPAVPEVAIMEKCPRCDGPMVLKPSHFGGYFLSCAKYPKCKGTAKVTPELQEQINAAAANAPAEAAG